MRRTLLTPLQVWHNITRMEQEGNETVVAAALRVADRLRYAVLEPDMTGRSRTRPGAPRQQQRRPKTIKGVRVPGAKNNVISIRIAQNQRLIRFVDVGGGKQSAGGGIGGTDGAGGGGAVEEGRLWPLPEDGA